MDCRKCSVILGVQGVAPITWTYLH